ncbi:hypothetical gene supported by BC032064; BC041612, isoform CRA_a [Homo sapiens]|nr:hypothetical gene supported by BC032064; BC041612, isoform CRA_a [Homo sapiens]BAC85694.1 unnamed protein product [Homo sapiens]
MVQRESLSSEGALGGKELQPRGWGTHHSRIPKSCTPAGRILVPSHYHHSPPVPQEPPCREQQESGSFRACRGLGSLASKPLGPGVSLTRNGTGVEPWGCGQAGLFPGPGNGSQGWSLAQVSCPWLRSLSLPGLRAHLKAEAELPPKLPLQEEEPEDSQSEPSPSAKQHKKAKKRKSLGAPVLHAVASMVSAPLETLRLEREWQSLDCSFSPCLWGPTWHNLAL